MGFNFKIGDKLVLTRNLPYPDWPKRTLCEVKQVYLPVETNYTFDQFLLEKPDGKTCVAGWDQLKAVRQTPSEALEHEHIVNCAVLDESGGVHSLSCYPSDWPSQHYHITRRMTQEGFSTTGTPGFVTNEGRFLNRTDAAKLALSIGQIKTLEDL